MARWKHRAKVVLIGLPIMLLLLALDLFGVMFDGIGELRQDWKDLCSCLRDEWTIGAQEAADRVASPGDHGA